MTVRKLLYLADSDDLEIDEGNISSCQRLGGQD